MAWLKDFSRATESECSMVLRVEVPNTYQGILLDIRYTGPRGNWHFHTLLRLWQNLDFGAHSLPTSSRPSANTAIICRQNSWPTILVFPSPAHKDLGHLMWRQKWIISGPFASIWRRARWVINQARMRSFRGPRGPHPRVNFHLLCSGCGVKGLYLASTWFAHPLLFTDDSSFHMQTDL